MKDIFIQCPHCKKAVSKKDFNEKSMERYGYSLNTKDSFLPIPCFHCEKSSYIQEWKVVFDIPRPHLTDDLFEI